MAWGRKSPQEKADSFDAQIAASERRAGQKKAQGKAPYDVDKKIESAGKAERRKKR